MKKVLLASTALVLSAGVAAADMTLSGDGRMGVRSLFGSDEVGFTSRFRAIFTGSGETDGGLAFGGTIRADNAGGVSFENLDGDNTITSDEIFAGGGAAGVAGSVFISGDFGTLTMGDVAGAPEAAVGDVAFTSLTGLGDYNEMLYLSNFASSSRSAARYDYSFGDFGVHVSADNPYDAINDTSRDTWGIAGTYAGDLFQAGLGFEQSGGDGSPTGDTDHWIGGVTVTVAGIAFEVAYGSASGDAEGEQYAVSASYTWDATTISGYYSDKSDLELNGAQVPNAYEAWGIGASYDLGGGAAVRGGYADRSGGPGDDGSSYDFGIVMTF
jgi:outer membrane protein OmpU